jgi:hypothetical protein
MSLEKDVSSEKKSISEDKSISGDPYFKNEAWIPDLDESEKDTESLKHPAFFENADELDIAIVNDITTLEDDPTLKSITLRAILVGFVSIYVI